MTSELSIAATALSACVASFFLLRDAAGPGAPLHRYRAHWHHRYSLLLLDREGDRDALLQLLLAILWLCAALLLESGLLLLTLPLWILGPLFWMERSLARRRQELSEGLAPWLSVLANSLRSTPNIAEGIAHSATLVSAPLSDELMLLCAELRYGMHLDEAIERSMRRMESPLYTSTMTTLLVGRQSGGDLSRLLVRSAGALREMERLEGLVRTKTAEGKSQTFVLALMPFALVAAMQSIDPGFLDGVWEDSLGRTMILIAAFAWMTGIALSRQIVKVDL